MGDVLQAYVLVQKIKFSKEISRYYNSHSRIFFTKKVILFLVFFQRYLFWYMSGRSANISRISFGFGFWLWRKASVIGKYCFSAK